MLFKLRTLLAFIFICFGFVATICWHRTGYTAPKYDLGPPYRRFNSTDPLPRTDFAIATFLTGQGANDAYFVATRMLAHQLLHAPSTKLNNTSVTFLILCSRSMPEDQKHRLKEDGATVVEVDDVPVNWWIHSGVRRWKEQFTKLRVFEMTEYKRILYIDADTILMHPLDAIFEEPEVISTVPTQFSRREQIKKDESVLPQEWFFAARSDNGWAGQRDHPVPPLQTTAFSAGFFMVAPDRQVYTHLLSVMSHFRRFDPFTMEQSLLNYVYRRHGPMPWRDLNWKWSATWPSEKDVQMGVASLHEKFWATGPEPLQDIWRKKKEEMLQFYK